LDIFGVSNVAEVQGFKLFEDPNITDEEKQRLHKRKTVRYETLFDFEKVKKHKLYDTSKSGTIHLDVLITPLGGRGENSSGGYLVQAQDITERKQVEEALRESEQNFRNSLDDSPLGIRIVTAEGKLLYANQAILDIYGYSSIEELKATATKKHYTPESYAEHQNRKERRKQGKPVPAEYEISIVRKDGEVRHLAVFRKEVIWNSEIQFQALYQDITERKQAAEELRIFKAISDRAGYGAGIIIPEGELIYVNESFAEMHGYTIKELIGKHLSIFHTREQMKLVERLNKKLIQKGSYVAQEVWHKKKDGTVFPTLMTGTAIKDDMGKSLYLSTTAIDITESKRVEIALWQSEEFNSSLLTNSPSPILVLNADASIRYVNPALEKLTGFSSAELLGSKPPYPWWMEEKRKELSRRLVQAMHRGTRKYESLYRKKNGEQFWVEKIFKTVKVDGEFKYYLVNWVDLTEQKRLKVNMEFYLSQVTRAQEEERKRIAREIHDESIQSLATLALGIDSIAKEKERLPEDVIRRLKGLRAETNSVLDELRRFSHELRPGVIDQVGLVPALEILTEELNKENRVKVSLEVAGSERRLIPETEVALFRIAQEALHNVQKHSRATQAAIRLKFARNRVRLTVSDNGRGFELPDTLSNLAAESKLGLIGIQERARLLNGKLLVRSGLGRGTTVVVEVANIG
jgi:PAS domain S-box-containing protein